MGPRGVGGGGGGLPPHRQGCIRREGASEAAPGVVRRAVGGGYCRLQMPLKPALAIRGTVAGRRPGALEEGWGGWGYLPSFRCIPVHRC